jgi:23S rRNA pseudouridine1911/1915/1917 synthase
MFAVYEDGDYGKHAVTHYRVIQRFGYVTLVECQLETGRTHQIRVHMKHIGHPLFNDKLYGGDKIVKGTIFTKYKEFIDNCFKLMPHQALHAFSLGFQHPTKDEKIYLEAQMPDYFKATLEKWERYTEGRLSK